MTHATVEVHHVCVLRLLTYWGALLPSEVPDLLRSSLPSEAPNLLRSSFAF